MVETLLSFRTKLDDDMECERKSSEEGPVPGPESVTRTTCRAPRCCWGTWRGQKSSEEGSPENLDTMKNRFAKKR